MTTPVRLLVSVLAGTALVATAHAGSARRFAPLFPDDRLDGWRVSNWSDVAAPPGRRDARWTLTRGVLHSADTGTWLVSPEEYGDFVLRLDARVDPGANGGIGMRFPPEGDPAYRGMEIQVIDAESEAHRNIGPAHRTAAVYDELVPAALPRPAGEWNRLEITCRGPRLRVDLNGRTAVDADLTRETGRRSRGVPLAERPRRGHLGFQNINGAVTYRNLRIRRLD